MLGWKLTDEVNTAENIKSSVLHVRFGRQHIVNAENVAVAYSFSFQRIYGTRQS